MSKVSKNSPATLTKIVNYAREGMAARVAAPLSACVHISGGNKKVGATGNISLPPVATCGGACKVCAGNCYAVKSYNQYKDTRNAWDDNYFMAMHRRGEFFAEISRAMWGMRFFRWHVSGEILDYDYFDHAVTTARKNQHCISLIFTKQYGIVNQWIKDHGGADALPDNLKVVFSVWRGLECPNPYNLPEVHVLQHDGNDTFKGDINADNVHVCGGSCEYCEYNGCGCFYTKPGDVVLIDIH